MTSSLPCGQTSLLLQMTERLALSDAHFRRISQLIYQRAGIVLAMITRFMSSYFVQLRIAKVNPILLLSTCST